MVCHIRASVSTFTNLVQLQHILQWWLTSTDAMVNSRCFVVCFLQKNTPNPRKIICCGKKAAQMPLLIYSVFFLGSGWPWVGECVGFIIMFICFTCVASPTKKNLKTWFSGQIHDWNHLYLRCFYVRRSVISAITPVTPPRDRVSGALTAVWQSDSSFRVL